MKPTLVLLAAALACSLHLVQACGSVYTRPEFMPHRHLLEETKGAAAHSAGAAEEGDHNPCLWNHNQAGLDWPGLDSTCNFTCAGLSQSPVNLPTTFSSTLTDATRANLQFGTAKNVRVLNIGHAIQVEFDGPYDGNASVVVAGDSIYSIYNESDPNAAAKLRRIPVQPLQFHMHATSEHLLHGNSGQLELHLVTKLNASEGVELPKECTATPTSKCLAVFGVIYNFVSDPTATEGDPVMQKIIDALPKDCEEAGPECRTDVEGWELNLAALLPNTRYVSYTGSLTTPPCTEGVMWHVFPTIKATLTPEQALALQSAVATATAHGSVVANRMNNRETLPLGGRQVFSSTA